MIGDAPNLSQHARMRWAERCVGLDPETEWARARRPGKKLRKRIGSTSRMAEQYLKTRFYQGLFYAVSPNQVVFVVGSNGNLVVTVWKLRP